MEQQRTCAVNTAATEVSQPVVVCTFPETYGRMSYLSAWGRILATVHVARHRKAAATDAEAEGTETVPTQYLVKSRKSRGACSIPNLIWFLARLLSMGLGLTTGGAKLLT